MCVDMQENEEQGGFGASCCCSAIEHATLGPAAPAIHEEASMMAIQDHQMIMMVEGSLI